MPRVTDLHGAVDTRSSRVLTRQRGRKGDGKYRASYIPRSSYRSPGHSMRARRGVLGGSHRTPDGRGDAKSTSHDSNRDLRHINFLSFGAMGDSPSGSPARVVPPEWEGSTWTSRRALVSAHLRLSAEVLPAIAEDRAHSPQGAMLIRSAYRGA
jgi:hypothetical protein